MSEELIPRPQMELFDNAQLFDPAGCLTRDGLQALSEERLDDLGRLEAAEHLSFCDRCLARYTALLESIRLSAPMRDLIPQVQALMHLRRFRVLTNRYVSTAAAIALALTLWRFGAFGGFSPAATTRTGALDAPQRPAFSELLGDALHGLSGGLNELLSTLQATVQSGWAQLADPGAPAAPQSKTAQAE